MWNTLGENENYERVIVKVKQTIVVDRAPPHHSVVHRTDERKKHHVTPDLSQAGELKLPTHETPNSEQQNDYEN